ncbi:patatin-like phospholipase family protein [Paracandidimonas soli]|uniref:NTE family protein n=1 Tax=Paracandidimonas soli TaxID=1917182 RepID=A0A4R3V163_9BURK|nr:patatin-like phospholipase family protein [Paracandidimonas soli]TCU98475.1 NTE family protein [Paracandidimonas soli]
MPTHRALEASPPGRGPVGLILTGGGARAAYQVGVLSAVMDILDPRRESGMANPFPIICGTSAGAINAAALGCRAHDPHLATDRLVQLWSNLRTGQIYHGDAARLLRTGVRWLSLLAFGWMAPGLRQRSPRSLLDNSPLRDLLADSLNFDRLARNFDAGHLTALAVTASAYTTGEHITFYQSHKRIQPWRRTLRHAEPAVIGVDHLMASSAIPFVFPAQSLMARKRAYWCGDGSMRQLAPISPAIHLGAEKIFVIGTGFRDETHPEEGEQTPDYPSLAQIGGHALANIFLDSISMDIERVDKVNELLAQTSENGLKIESLRPISTFAVTPSQSLDAIALRHLSQLPRAARALFRVLGVSAAKGAQRGGALISYLLFEAAYTRELIELGRADCLSRMEEVKAFFKEAQE